MPALAKTLLPFAATLALAALALVGACDSNGGGTACFSPAHGPSDPSCAGFTVGLTCPVDVQPWYSCTCTATDAGATGDAADAGAAGQTWVCMPTGMGTGGSGGSDAGGSGSGGATTAGTGGSTDAGNTGSTDAGNDASEGGG